MTFIFNKFYYFIFVFIYAKIVFNRPSLYTNQYVSEKSPI